MVGEQRQAQDVELVRRALAGDPAAVGGFLERMRCVPRMLHVRNAHLGSPLDAEELADLVQDTLLAVWAKLPTFDGRAALETWVYRFCQLELLRRLRAQHRAPWSLVDVDSQPSHAPTEGAADAEELERLLEGLGELAPELGLVLHLKHVEGLTFDQIGERLSISPNTAKTRYYRGLDKLRGRLGQRTATSAGGEA